MNNELLNRLKKQKGLVIVIALVLIVAIVVVGRRVLQNNQKISNSGIATSTIKTVGVMPLSAGLADDLLSTEGTVKAATKVDVVALANGTVKTVAFKSGDTVVANQPLAYLHDDILLTNLTNASVNYGNQEQNMANTGKLTDESVRQAELSVLRAQEAVAAAKIGLVTAKDNYANGKNIQTQNKADALNNAVVTFNSHLNTINSFLDQSNYIIKAEGYDQLPGIGLTLSVKNSQRLVDAKNDYIIARAHYLILAARQPTPDSIVSDYKELGLNLTETKRLADDMVDVLAATISHTQFNEAALSAQKSTFTGLRSGIIGVQSAVQATQQALENYNTNTKQQLDGLANSVRAAENQLTQANIAYDAAKSGLDTSKSSKNQQLALTKGSVDNARGQYNLLATQATDLLVKAPIAGQIGAKAIDIGTEVRIGQKVAEISQIDSVKIVLGLSQDDAKRITLGQVATINQKFKGVVNQIDPAADAVTKKVKVEIIFNNKNKELTPETLVKINLMVKKQNGPSANYQLPLNAISIGQNESSILILDGDRAKKSVISLVQVNGEQAIITGNFTKDTLVIIDGNKLVADGELVSVKK
ncbi:MAG: efflux RND transporter periplasmic adaptor subunit [Candidatus Falkowbacteria bacterium]